MGKYALITVVGFVVIFGRISLNLNRTHEALVENVSTRYEQAQARMAAISLANMAISSLDESTFWRAGYHGVELGETLGSAGLADWGTDPSLPRGRVRITAAGQTGSAVATAVVLASVPSVPMGVHASITANATVRELGNLQTDGRDHDLDGNVIPFAGTFGVSTKQIVIQGGSSDIGGTFDGLDYAPSHPAHPSVLEEYATYDFPDTPDKVFGYAEGTLKAMAQSGANGGQYATDPATLAFPLSGVTYVELPSDVTWQSMDFLQSSGVLIVHNAAGDAKIKNLNGGVFRGLIIADDIEKIHSRILGGIVAMAETPSGNCIGNGSGEVLYCSAALVEAARVAAGGGSGMRVLSWVE